MRFLALAATLAAAAAAARTPEAETYTLPLAVHNGSVANLTTAVGSRPLDTVYITNPNGSTYEWWYFDAVAADLSASVVLQPVLQDWFGMVLDVSFANGSGAQFTVPSIPSSFSTAGDGSNVVTADGQWSYASAPDLSQVTFRLNMTSIGVTGSVRFQSVAPPHVACSGIRDGAGLELYWNLFWINLMPDAAVSVDLELNGTAMAFEGFGYHDKKWGASPYAADLDQWYWGHGRAGEYSVVWFYRLNPAGDVNASGYIAKDNEIVYAACGEDVSIRPFTDNGTLYPIPYPYDDNIIKGLDISIDAGKTGKFAFKATKSFDILGGPTYHRLVGNFTGGLVGQECTAGSALWEMQGPFTPSP